MRIFEITDRNKSWKGITSTNIDYEAEYQHILNVYKTYTSLRRINSYPIILSQIQEFIKEATRFLNIKFPDSNDDDVVSEKEKVQKMIDHLQTLVPSLK